MSPTAPDGPGTFAGQTELNDGVVWTWDGQEWMRRRQSGILRKARPDSLREEQRDRDDRA